MSMASLEMAYVWTWETFLELKTKLKVVESFSSLFSVQSGVQGTALASSALLLISLNRYLQMANGSSTAACMLAAGSNYS